MKSLPRPWYFQNLISAPPAVAAAAAIATAARREAVRRRGAAAGAAAARPEVDARSETEACIGAVRRVCVRVCGLLRASARAVAEERALSAI
jgi:hypothetical protein